jgi:hypothetical protein
MNNLLTIQPIVEQLLNDKQIAYLVNEDLEKERNVIEMGFKLKSGIVNTYFVIHHSIQIVEIFTYLPICVPEEKRLEVSKFLDMVEATYFIGSFQLNHNDGRLRTKSYFTHDYKGISAETIDLHLTAINLLADETFSDVLKICFGNRDAESLFSESCKRVDARMN